MDTFTPTDKLTEDELRQINAYWTAAAGLGFIGLDVDPTLNADLIGDGDISAAGARVRTLAIAAREDAEVARDVRKVLSIPA